MINSGKSYRIIAIVFLFALTISCIRTTGPVENVAEQQDEFAAVRPVLDSLNARFSADYIAGDSFALADQYASDGTFGSVQGRDDLAATWGRLMRSWKGNGYAEINFIISGLTTDGVFMVEIGKAEFIYTTGQVADSGTYLVVRKQENGIWKIYRDMGL